jgi:hypothetical protein
VIYVASDTHANQEDPNGTWFVIDGNTKQRFGFGFLDFKSEPEARQFAQWLNHAYERGKNDAIYQDILKRP